MSEQKFHKRARPLVNTWVHCQLGDVNTKYGYDNLGFIFRDT